MTIHGVFCNVSAKEHTFITLPRFLGARIDEPYSWLVTRWPGVCTYPAIHFSIASRTILVMLILPSVSYIVMPLTFKLLSI